jgi:hypothetical protein
MNDFTKKELKWIATSIAGYDFDSLSMEGRDELIDVLNKVLSMIDEYCEHEYKKTLSKSGMYFISMCHKCRDEKPFR